MCLRVYSSAKGSYAGVTISQLLRTLIEIRIKLVNSLVEGLYSLARIITTAREYCQC